jgi:hypothetical protein
MASNDEHFANSKVGKVVLSKLKIDPSYQRNPSPTLIEEVERDWNPLTVGLLLVSDRGNRPEDSGVEGGLFLIDGQHRSIVGRRLKITHLEARIIDLSEEDDPAAIEAALRLTTNVGLRDSATERFKAKVRAGDPESIDIVKILTQSGTFVKFNQAEEGGLTCIASIEKIYRVDHHGALLRNTLELTKEGFAHYDRDTGALTDPLPGKAGSASMLKAMAWFLQANYEAADHTRLIEKLVEAKPAVIDNRARIIQGTMSGSLWFNYYRAIVDLYNERLTDRRRLEWVSRGAGSLGGKARRDQA